MNHHTTVRFTVSALLLIGMTCVALAGAYDNYLKTSDLEQVARMKGAKSIARNPSIGAGGDLNFTTADDKLIVMVQIVDQSHYAGYKKMFFKADVKGLGTQAMQGATFPGAANNLVAFRKGSKCVALTSFMDMKTSKNMLTPEQLIALGKIIASRMP
jgi:hypothetical protein